MSNELTKYKTDLLTDLRDPEYAALYVSSALRESPEEFLLALRDVAEARKMSKVAGEAKLNRVSLYRMLSGSGNPRLSSLVNVLKTMSLRLAAVVDNSANESPDAPNHESDTAAGPAPIISQGIAGESGAKDS